mgnify:FL=1
MSNQLENSLFDIHLVSKIHLDKELNVSNRSFSSLKKNILSSLAAPYPEEFEPNQLLNDLHRKMA